MNEKKLGILGGGQLSKMLVSSALKLNISTVVLDKQNSCGMVSDYVIGDYKSREDIQKLKCDLLTIEIEHVNTQALQGLQVQPTVKTIELIQDKFKQKEYLKGCGVPMGDFTEIVDADTLALVGKEYGYPLMLKSKTLAYDGRGNFVLSSPADIPLALEKMGKQVYAERFVSFEKEIACIVCKHQDGVVSYECVETIQKDNICHLVIAPARVSDSIRTKARKIAEQVVNQFDGLGVYGVELFLTSQGDVLLNEVACRVHNSGHYTIESCYTDQFENHLRCVLGMPLGSTDMKVNASVMVNLIGEEDGQVGARKLKELIDKAMRIKGASVHDYGKEIRKGRKMGHITITGSSMDQVMQSVKELTGDLVFDIGESLESQKRPLVGVIMGSDSDLPTVKPCLQILEQFGIPFEVSIVSAHRTPERMVQYAKSAHTRGLKVIVAAAGGAAHLPGMVASMTPLPVIGIPVSLKLLDGMDSLLSIVQMPKGVPVATVAINNAVNAGLLAARIIGTGDARVMKIVQDYSSEQEQEVLKKVDRLESVGWKTY